MDAAIDKILRERPDLFDRNGVIVSHEASLQYHAGVVANLIAEGFCAFFDGEEIAAKRTNDFSEQWDIESAGGRSIRLYAATCRPAWEAIPSAGSPAPTPSPTPGPSPSPCVPETVTVPFDKCGAEPECWKCAERIAWDVAKGDWTPLPGAEGRLWYNHPGGDPNRWEYIDAKCNYVRRDGSIIRTTEQQWGRACIDNQAICPETRTITKPCPSPTPGPVPTPQPGPSPSVCPAFACLHVNVHHCLNSASQTVQQPVVGGKCHLDVTPLFSRCNSSGRCNPEQCNPEHDFCACGAWPNWRRCESPDGYCWRQTVGPSVRWLVDDREGGTKGWKATLDKLVPGRYVVEAFTCDQRDAEGVPVPGSGRGTVMFEVH